MSAAVLWPSVLGLTIFAVGICTYRRELFAPDSRWTFRILFFGPIFIAAALATFSGQHFTITRDFAQLVPKWLPARIFITYLVGVCLLAAALSLVARKCVRCSAPLLAVLFALFVLLIFLPSLIRHPGARIAWIFPFREGSYALGALCIYLYERRARSRGFALFLRLWTGLVVIFYGIQNLLYPQFSPGVPDTRPTSAWVPAPHVLAYIVGALMVALGAAALFKKTSVAAITGVGMLMAVLTFALFAPDLFLVHGVANRITAIDFVADTILFSGTMLVIARAVALSYE